MEKPKTKVAIYLRVSTDEQAKEGYGLIFQEEKLRSFVNSQDYSLNEAHVYKDEGYSGTLPLEQRPALMKLMEDATKHEFSIVLVYRIDRLFRKTRLLLNVIEKMDSVNVGFRSITENFDSTNTTGRFMITMLGGIAEMERDTIRERTINGRIAAAKTGRWVTGVPTYGYRVIKETKKLEIIEEQAELVKQMFDWLVYERLSLKELAKRMNALHVSTPKHKRKSGKLTFNHWYERTIGRILTNETYTGTTYFRKYKRPFKNLTSLINDDQKRPEVDWIKINVPPIISVEQFEMAKEQLTKNRVNAQRNMKHEYMFSKLIHCGYCGFKMFCGYQPPKRNIGVGTKYYHGVHRKLNTIGTTKRCDRCMQYAESRLEPIWDCLKDILENPKNLRKPLEKYKFKIEDKDVIAQKIKQNEEKIKNIEIKKQKLNRLYIDSEMNETEYNELSQEYNKTITEFKNSNLKFQQSLITNVEKIDREKTLTLLYKKIKDRLDNAVYNDKEHILHLFVERVNLYAKTNLADVIFKFPKEQTDGNSEVPLVISVKTLSEREIGALNIRKNPKMYKGTI